MNNEFLEKLKPGDKVIIERSFGRRKLATVERITKTMIITQESQRFNRRDGHTVGPKSYGSAWLLEPTQERLDEVEKFRLMAKLRSTDWEKYSLSELQEIDKILRLSEFWEVREPLKIKR